MTACEKHADCRFEFKITNELAFVALRNAAKFTGKHPTARIEVGVTEREGQAAYFVRDDGAGFDMAYAHRLFGAFQRLHAAGGDDRRDRLGFQRRGWGPVGRPYAVVLVDDQPHADHGLYLRQHGQRGHDRHRLRH